MPPRGDGNQGHARPRVGAGRAIWSEEGYQGAQWVGAVSALGGLSGAWNRLRGRPCSEVSHVGGGQRWGQGATHPTVPTPHHRPGRLPAVRHAHVVSGAHALGPSCPSKGGVTTPSPGLTVRGWASAPTLPLPSGPARMGEAKGPGRSQRGRSPDCRQAQGSVMSLRVLRRGKGVGLFFWRET